MDPKKQEEIHNELKKLLEKHNCEIGIEHMIVIKEIQSNEPKEANEPRT
jgi:hypothetical protein